MIQRRAHPHLEVERNNAKSFTGVTCILYSQILTGQARGVPNESNYKSNDAEHRLQQESLGKWATQT